MHRLYLRFGYIVFKINDIIITNCVLQVLVHGVLKSWGISGFIEHTNLVKSFYKRQRNLMVAAADKHLKGFRLLYKYFHLKNKNVLFFL